MNEFSGELQLILLQQGSQQKASGLGSWNQ